MSVGVRVSGRGEGRGKRLRDPPLQLDDTAEKYYFRLQQSQSKNPVYDIALCCHGIT